MAAHVFDWEERYRSDQRLHDVQSALDRILNNSFPAIAARLRRADPPRQRYAPASAASSQREEKATSRDADMTENAAAVASAALKREKRHLSKTSKPEFLDPVKFSGDSSSEMESQAEFDPMDELQDLEEQHERRVLAGHNNGRPATGTAVPVPEPRKPNDDGDVEMEESRPEAQQRVVDHGLDMAVDEETKDGDDNEEEEDEEEEEEENDDTVCTVCKTSEDEGNILMCDTCDAEYHLYCLSPPLTAVPEGDWFCPTCTAARQSSAAPAAPPTTSIAVPVAQMQSTPVATTAPAPGIDSQAVKPEDRPSQRTTDSADPDELSIADSLEANAEKSNQLLIHACNCDDAKCTDATYHALCGHMKRFLRTACWASHNEKWIKYRVARSIAALLSYHSLHCALAPTESCNVPLCDELRAEEYV
ncbi:hypothetical protein PINS_up022233 [Pythium insidiosum]|nr:hypothetical protein PINS_up022233 [Pythium insidiosum]